MQDCIVILCARWSRARDGLVDSSVSLMHNLAVRLAPVADLVCTSEYIACDRAWPLEPLATTIERELVLQEALAF